MPTLSAKIAELIDNLGRLTKKYLVWIALSALVVSAGVLVSCSSASKSSSSKGKRQPIFERAVEPPSGAASDTPVTPVAVPAQGAMSDELIDSIRRGTPDVSSTDLGSLSEIYPDAGKNLSVDSLMARVAASFPDSLSWVADYILTVPVDSLAGFIDTLPENVKALMPPELPNLLREYTAGKAGALEDVRQLRDSIRRPIPASVRSLLPDSIRGLSDDSLRRFAAANGIGIPTDYDIYTDPDVVMKTGDLNIIADTARTPQKAFLEHPVFGKNQDSLVYDVKNRYIFVYGKGDLMYEDKNLKADFMILNVDTKEIYGTGVMDTVTGKMTRPEFLQAGSNPMTMDTMTYNLTSGKAKVKGVATKDGEGYLLGRELKKMPDNTINLAHGAYTTCDRIEHPHFYIAMTKAKVIPGKKIITGPAYFVMEDVPIYFLGIPGGFFPISSGPRSGFIMPTYGEESSRGFFLRDGGYYFTFGDYADLKLTGGIYTLGSWEAAAQTNYVVRYKFGGNLGLNYAKTILGEKNSADYQNSNNFKLTWSHRQDPKFHPGSTFSASVNFSTAGYNKQGATTSLNDLLNTQTNSSISYGKSWMAGSTAINLTVALSHSQNSRDSTIALTLPNISFSVGSFAPFKRKVAAGKQRWYEKITMSYSMAASNSILAKEYDLFTTKTVREMRNGVSHKIPIKTSFTMFRGALTFSPSLNYNENWFFKKERREWDPVEKKVKTLDPEFGFFRMYSYNASGSFSTKLYGMYQMKKKPGKTAGLQAVRHVMTPSVGFTLAPDFRKPQYGFVDYYQSDSTGRYTQYNPYVGSQSMSAGAPTASINFSLSNQIEMKIGSKNDSTGVKKIPIIEQLSASGSYNFLADSMNLSNISLTLRTGNIFKNFGIQLSAVWDPYVVLDNNGSPKRIGKYNVGHGKFGRIASTSWSFGYTFNSSQSNQPAMNNINSSNYVGAYVNPFDMENEMEPAMRRQYMVSSYYDFSIPWNFGFNYSVSYANNGIKSTVTQTLGFQGSVTLTAKWGINFNGGFDIAKRKFTPMQVSLARDLHCWSMSFQWIPIGTMKSYQFHIGVKSSMLSDLKYDKSSSRYDNLEQ